MMVRLWWGVAFFGIAISSGYAEPPSLAGLFPGGGAADSEFTVEASGKNETWPASVWSGVDGLTFEPIPDKKGQWKVRIAADCRPGVHLLRAYHAGGASAVRQFVVADADAGVELKEEEPNQHYKEAQCVTPAGDALAVVVNGTLNPSEDVDCFSVELEKGQWLIAEASAYRLDAPVDPLLHVRDQEGTRLAFNHDREGPALDPRLAFEAPAAGKYTVELAGFVYPPKNDIRLTGNREAVYRLRLSVAPEVRAVFPTGIRAGGTHRVELIGWNLPERHVTLSCQDRLPMVVGTEPEFVETSGDGTQRLGAAPVNLSGRIEAPGDVDLFTLAVKKGEQLSVHVRTWEVGSMLDPIVRLLSADGKELAKGDDVGTLRPDAKINWKAAEDGDVRVEVRSRLSGEGSAEHIYRLEVDAPQPSLSITVPNDRFEVTAGAELEVKATANRNHGYAKATKLTAKGLPDTIVMQPVEVPEKGGEVTLKFVASEEAMPWTGSFQIVAEDGAVGAFAFKGAYADAGNLFVNEVRDLWLTVLPKKEKQGGE